MSLLNDELTVRSLLFENAKAVCAKDLDKIMAQYAPDVRAFDAVAQLQFRGIKEYRKHWEKCLNFCPGPTIFEIDHLEVEVEHNLALCHCLIHCGEVNEAGESATSWMRATICFKKIKGEWKIIHEHYSLPFDMVSGETMFQLKP